MGKRKYSSEGILIESDGWGWEDYELIILLRFYVIQNYAVLYHIKRNIYRVRYIWVDI